MNVSDFAATVSDELPRTVPDGQPIVMINLLRYHTWAVYPPGTGKEQVTGRQAYDHYSRLTLPHLMKVGGRLIWRADIRASLIAPKEERWDEILLVEYPSRSAFERMIANPEYQSGVIHRTAALEDSRLIAATSPQRIGRLAWWALKLSSKFRSLRSG
jgi:uncharacterized protein (DUF1330 family)